MGLSENAQERVYRVALLATGLLRFINLGFKDLQAWDEALYAMRAEGILRFGGWLDQTSFAVDGLYSSLHPPLYVWLTTIAFHLFGVNEFSARFFSALLGGLTLFVIYGIGKKIVNRHVGFLAAVLFGLHPFTTFFARQGQFDTALVFFLSLAVYFLNNNEYQPSPRNVILAGLSTSAALMTKLYVG
ncbi:MAG TPA: glycosyltransferase family 39 protein, partial [Nitrososphaera sp.]|nr:glycosyltransferase family 39 protein [Nitrososphaera sp.]